MRGYTLGEDFKLLKVGHFGGLGGPRGRPNHPNYQSPIRSFLFFIFYIAIPSAATVVSRLLAGCRRKSSPSQPPSPHSCQATATPTGDLASWSEGPAGAEIRPKSGSKRTRIYIRTLKSKFSCWSVFGQFPAKIRPGIVTNGPGLKNVACINEK